MTRDDFTFYYAESVSRRSGSTSGRLTSSFRDGYYGHTTKLDIAYVFNVRQDPYESYDQAPGPRADDHPAEDLAVQRCHGSTRGTMATLQKYPPKQKGTSLSVGN